MFENHSTKDINKLAAGATADNYIKDYQKKIDEEINEYNQSLKKQKNKKLDELKLNFNKKIEEETRIYEDELKNQ